jgi:hypothetical protein
MHERNEKSGLPVSYLDLLVDMPPAKRKTFWLQDLTDGEHSCKVRGPRYLKNENIFSQIRRGEAQLVGH